MTTRTYLRLSLLAPVVVPLLLLPLLLIDPLPAVVGSLMGILLFSLLIGGIPYVLFAVGLYVYLDPADERGWVRASWAAPLLYVPVLCACLLALSLLMVRPEQGSLLAGMAYYAAWGLGVGYFYVLLVHAVRGVLTRWGLVRGEPVAAPA
ncbi:MAG TPA: hypothetical protein VFQ45_18655 [Longimicrobium sp.]|nr:hypothetical protein [Longimicrobium sp.]